MATQINSADKVDFKKVFATLYNPRGTACTLVTPPPFSVLAVDGTGDPNTSATFASAVGMLYATAYTLKFARKKVGNGPDFVVMPLEGLWWVAEGEEFSFSVKSNWLWTALIVLPDFVTAADVEAAVPIARGKSNPDVPVDVLYRIFDEGPSAQVLHLGPYAGEEPTVARLNSFIAAQGLVQAGKHHEIYLSDPGRVAPEKMRTVVRLPVGKIESHI